MKISYDMSISEVKEMLEAYYTRSPWGYEFVQKMNELSDQEIRVWML